MPLGLLTISLYGLLYFKFLRYDYLANLFTVPVNEQM